MRRLTLRQLSSTDAEERERAVRSLGERGGNSAAASLVEALNDENELVRAAAVEALGAIADQDTMVSLIGALTDRSYRVRTRAVNALGSLKWTPGDNHERALLAVARARWDHVLSLGEAALDALLIALTTFDEGRNEAVRAIGAIGGPRAVSLLIDAVEFGDPPVVEQAAKALGEIRNERALGPLVEQLGRIEFSTDANRVRDALIQGLACFGAAAVERLDHYIANHPSRALPFVQAISQIGGVAAVRPLAKAFGSSERDIRVEAARGLTRVGIPAVTWLAGLLGDADLDIHCGAAEALEVIFWEVLVEWQQVFCLVALGKVDKAARFGERAVAPLLAALDVWHGESRVALIKTLGVIGDQRATARLIGFLTENDELRHHAAEALGNIRDQRAVGPIIDGLRKGWGATRREVEALGKIGDPWGARPLLPLLKKPALAQHAAGALAGILKKSAAEFYSDDLHSIERLEDVIQLSYPLEGEEWQATASVRVDCSLLKRLTARELTRRSGRQ